MSTARSTIVRKSSTLALQLNLSMLRASGVQQIADQARHVLHLPLDQFARLGADLCIGGGKLEYLHGVAQRCEGIAQLMSQDCEELVLVPIGDRQLCHALPQVLLGLREGIDIDQDDGRAVDAVFLGAVRPDSQQIPAAVKARDFGFLSCSLSRLRQRAIAGKLSIWSLRFISQIERPTSVGRMLKAFCASGVKRRIRRSRHSITTAISMLLKRLIEIVVGAVQFIIAHAQFLVDGGEFFVAGLNLLFGSLQFLVGALKFFVRRLHFLVGRLKFLVGRFLRLRSSIRDIRALPRVPESAHESAARNHRVAGLWSSTAANGSFGDWPARAPAARTGSNSSGVPGGA